MSIEAAVADLSVVDDDCHREIQAALAASLIQDGSDDDGDGSAYSYSDDDENISISDYIVKVNAHEDKEEDANKDWIMVQNEVIEGLKQDAARVWPSLSPGDKAKKNYILAALKSPSLPPVKEFEHTISDDLRKRDRDITLAYLRREDYGDISAARGTRIPRTFCGDKEVMMLACHKSAHALQQATIELRRDLDVIRVAVRAHTGQMQYADEIVRKHNASLWREALKQNIREFFDIPDGCKAQKTIVQERDIIYRVITEIDGGGKNLRRASEDLQKDEELVLTALSNSTNCEIFALRVSPRSMDFLRRAVVAEPKVIALPKIREDLNEAQTNELVTSAAEHAKSRSNLNQIVRSIQNFSDISTAVEAVRASEGFQRFRDPAFCSSAEQMHTAVKNDGLSMIFIAPALQNEEFLLRCIAASKSVRCRVQNYRYLRTQWKRNQRIVRHVIREATPNEAEIVADAATACPEVFHDRDFLAHCVKKNGLLDEKIWGTTFVKIVLGALRRYSNDSEIMQGAITNSKNCAHKILPFVGDSVKIDAAYWLAFVSSWQTYHEHVPEYIKSTQDVRFIQKLCIIEQDTPMNHIPAWFWRRGLAKQWRSSTDDDSNFVAFRNFLKGQIEVGMMMLEFGKNHLDKMDVLLNQDKGFVRKTLAIDTRHYQNAPNHIKYDMMLACAALQEDVGSLNFASANELESLLQAIQRRLDSSGQVSELIEPIARSILGGAAAMKNAPRSGKDVSSRISRFAGAPIGEDLCLLKNAANVLGDLISEAESQEGNKRRKTS